MYDFLVPRASVIWPNWGGSEAVYRRHRGNCRIEGAFKCFLPYESLSLDFCLTGMSSEERELHKGVSDLLSKLVRPPDAKMKLQRYVFPGSEVESRVRSSVFYEWLTFSCFALPCVRSSCLCHFLMNTGHFE